MVERPARSENQQHSGEIAVTLLSIGAISVATDKVYTWSSGLESPIYSDMRRLISEVEDRKRVADLLANLVSSIGKIDGVAGTATAGIPHAAWVAERLKLPLVYVRSEAKDHGKKNRIEGKIEKGKKYAVIEDLVSTGGSSIDSAEALRAEGAICENVVSIFDYKLPVSKQNAGDAGLRLHSLTDFPTVMRIAIQNGLWTNEQATIARDWYQTQIN